MPTKLISLVIPVYNEEEAIPLFLRTVQSVLAGEPYAFEFVFVNDGSRDRTLNELLAARNADPRVRIVDLSRNFGKEHAMAAGFHLARGAAVIPMDVDLQDPPELIRAFLRKWEEGFAVVIGVRRERTSDTRFKRRSAGLFSQVFNKLCGCNLVPNAGDYRLMDRAVLDALNSLPERVRFTKGLYAWVGFPQALVPYDRPPRAAGTTKWNAWKLWNFALDGITSFSTLPLRIWSYLGMFVALCGFIYAGWLVLRTLLYGADQAGYPSLMVSVLTLGGLTLVSLGVIGEYLGRIFEEVKGRPLFLVRSAVGFEPDREPESDGLCGEVAQAGEAAGAPLPASPDAEPETECPGQAAANAEGDTLRS